jgi:NAD(P)-dependent dehydrogenase (short-subunit alcohol dehydrogenase family)
MIDATLDGSTKRVCLLTGASGRFGAAFCRSYSSKYAIVAVDRTEPPPGVATQQSRFVDPGAPGAMPTENEHPVFAIRADLSGEREYERVVELALARFGRIDLIVNAAVHWDSGLLLENERLLDNATQQFWLNTILPVQLSVHVARTFWRSREAENKERNRNVVNISSRSSLRLVSGTGQSVYSASKAALNAFTAHLASEFERIGVRVNAIAPMSFGEHLKVERVAEVVTELDEGTANGKIARLDETGLQLLEFSDAD